MAKRGGKKVVGVLEGGGYCEGRRLRRSRPESETALSSEVVVWSEKENVEAMGVALCPCCYGSMVMNVMCESCCSVKAVRGLTCMYCYLWR